MIIIDKKLYQEKLIFSYIYSILFVQDYIFIGYVITSPQFFSFIFMDPVFKI